MREKLAKLSDDEFYELMANTQPFELIIKSAIVIETEMEDLIDAMFIEPKHLFEIGITFENKVALCCAIGMDKRLKPTLSALANLRNKFAHNLDVSFGKSEADNFLSTMSRLEKSVMRETYGKTQRAQRIPFNDLGYEDRFAIGIVTLRNAIRAASIVAKDKLIKSLISSQSW